MVDTVRTLAQLITASADNSTGNYTNANQRDALLTLHSFFGPGSMLATAFLPVGHTLGRLIGGVAAPISTYFASTAAANAFFGSTVCTATTNYTDRCVIQAALNACASAGGGNVTVYGPSVYTDASLTWDPSVVTLLNSPQTYYKTETCGTSPAFALAVVASDGNIASRVGMIGGIVQAKNAGITAFGQTGSGVANTGYRSGAVAVNISNMVSGIAMADVLFVNFDTPHTWTGDNVYVLTFRNCSYVNNNYGPNIGTLSTPATNQAIEGMRWTGGGSDGNNYGFVFNVPAESGSIYLSDMSIDYNIVRSGWYDGLGAGNDCNIPLFLDRIHQESNGATSGYTTGAFYNNGNFHLSNVVGYWNDATNTVGWIESANYARTALTGCMVPGQNSTQPVVYSSGTTQGYVSAASLTDRFYANYIPLLSTSAGIRMFSGRSLQIILPVSFTLTLEFQTAKTLLSVGGTLTLPPDSTANHYIGATLVFVTTDTASWTFAQGAGVTITSVGSGLTFGGTAGKVVALIKTAANSWLACGNMT